MKTLSTRLRTVFATLLMLVHAPAIFSQDAGISRIVSPQMSGNLSSISAYIMEVTLQNYGSTTLSSVPINYSVNGTVTVTGNWSGTLIPGDSVHVLISPPFSVQNGANMICAFTDLPGDLDNTNDTTCAAVNALPIGLLPYQTDFEAVPPAGWFVNTPGGNPTQWEWGTPSYGQTNSAHSGTKAFDTDLDSTYSPGTDHLETPYFDFSSSPNPQLSFWQNRWIDFGGSGGGMRVDYTIDQGITWGTLGSMGAPGSVSWYNNDSLITTGQPAWDSSSMAWQVSMIEMPAFAFFAQPVRFRFVFDGVAGFNPGVSIDDFMVTSDSFYVSFNSSNIFCYGDSGMVTAVGNGGVPPYTYQWSNGVTTALNSGILSGTYTVTVWDGVLNSATGSYNLTEPPQIVITTSTTPATCALASGNALLNVTGGVPPYSYSWPLFPGNVNDNISGVPGGSYTFYVTDSNGCFNSGSVTVGVVSPLNAQQTVSLNPTSCTACDGSITLSVSSGTPPYSFGWINGETTQNVTNLCTGYYFCIVMDANSCSVLIQGHLQTPSYDVIATSVPATCGVNNGLASANVIGGTSPYTFLWSTSQAQQTLNNLGVGIYTVSVTDAFNCWAQSTVVVDDSCHGVWPGDANYDLAVNNNDLLNIGLAYGSTGPLRPSASLNWVAQPCPQWGNSFISGANYKNADCNGDGVVDDNDTVAIIQNYGLTHAFKTSYIQWLPGQPELTLLVSTDTTGLSDTINIDVLLGSGAIPVDSIFGLAFSINTDPLLVDSSFAGVDFSNNWIGTQGTNLLTLAKNRLAEGAIDIAMVRNDHVNVSGNGAIARATVVTTDNIAGKGITPSELLSFTFSGVRAITKNDYELLLNQGADSVIIDSAFATGIVNNHFEDQFAIQPNPSNGIFYISNKGFAKEVELSITNLEGQLILHTDINQKLTMLDLSGNSAGIYFLTIKSGNRMLNKKLVITR